MKIYPAYDPPEYREWQPDPKVMADYSVRMSEPEIKKSLQSLGEEGLENLYRGLIRARIHDITLKRWVRTGVITKAWLGTGEEAVTVGACHALGDGDVVGPMIRNAAATFERGLPMEESFRSYLATGDGVTKGRDLHFGDLKYGVVAPISHVGDLVPVCAGFALSFQLRQEQKVALTWVGDGSTRTGAVHEGLSLASARRLPLIVMVQDNAVALGTRRDPRLDDSLRGMAASYGVTGLECDGNHILDVHACVRQAREICVAGEGPVVILARTFRFGGHATHDEAEARAIFSSEDFSGWALKEPIGCFESWLRDHRGDTGADQLEQWEAEETAKVEALAENALASKDQSPPDPGLMLGDVFAGD
ncbi:MAG: thiamine pyrophosphate-dependent dehydrogenase E1 component subunit alpha [Planctomycetes bacterium]|nr:thiamine pyrophosphate-dependent dehydrogenase E1 component subunit alpha [Planctomycetota bacterium]